MNAKVLTSLLFGFFALVLAAGMASAAFSIPSDTSIVLTDANPSYNLSITGITNPVSFVYGTSTPEGFAISKLPSLTSDGSVIINASSRPSSAGIFKQALNITDGTTTIPVIVTYIRGLCSDKAAGGNLEINDMNIDTTGDDEEEWMPLDRITIEVEVENTNEDDNIKGVYVVLSLLDEKNSNKVKDLDFSNSGKDKISLGTVKADSSKTAIFEFQVPADFNSGDYKLMIKAYSNDLKEANECIDHDTSNTDVFEQNDYYNDITISQQDDENKYFAFDNIEISPSPAACGDIVTLSADIWNVGDEDFEDKIQVELVNNELGINLVQEINKDMDMGDKASVEFQFTLPQNAANKKYTLSLISSYGWDDGEYDYESDPTNVQLELIGCAVVPVEPASITADMVSEQAIAGKEVQVKATITNSLSTQANFAIDATGYDSWATLTDVSNRLITLAPGASKDVTFTFQVNSNAAGVKSFTVEATASGATAQRDVELTIQKPASWLDSLGGNSMIWVIGGINLILIVLIIVVAVKLAKN